MRSSDRTRTAGETAEGKAFLVTEAVRFFLKRCLSLRSSIIFLGGPNYHGDNLLIEAGTPLLR